MPQEIAQHIKKEVRLFHVFDSHRLMAGPVRLAKRSHLALHSGKKFWQFCDTRWDSNREMFPWARQDADLRSRNEAFHLLLPGSLCHLVVQDPIASPCSSKERSRLRSVHFATETMYRKPRKREVNFCTWETWKEYFDSNRGCNIVVAAFRTGSGFDLGRGGKESCKL